MQQAYDPQAELAAIPEGARQKSSASNPSGNGCVGWAKTGDGCVVLYDTNHPQHGAFKFDKTEWDAFTVAAARGELPTL